MYTLEEAVGTIAHDWKWIWLIPGAGAVAVLAVFVTFFHEPRAGAPAALPDPQHEDYGEPPP
jgi:hypothetical protein